MGFNKSISKKACCALALLAVCVFVFWEVGYSLPWRGEKSQNSSGYYAEAGKNSSEKDASGDTDSGYDPGDDSVGFSDDGFSDTGDGLYGDLSDGSSENETHKHDFSEIYRKAPDCENGGFIVYKCACGQEKQDVLPAKGHSFDLNGDDYITVAKCRDCEKTAKNSCASGETLLKSKIDFGYFGDLEDVYGVLTQKLNETTEPNFYCSSEFINDFLEKYSEFISLAVKSRETYLNAYVLSVADDSAAEIADKAQKIYDEYSFKGINLLSEIKSSVLSEYFYSPKYGWSGKAMQSLDELSAIYAEKGGEYRALLNEKSNIDAEISKAGENSSQINGLYYDRAVCDKKIAELFGFDGEADFGYGEYANKFLYRREYKPNKTVKVKKYAKKYLIPHLKSLAAKAAENQNCVGGGNADAEYSIFNDSVFDSCKASEIFSEYLKALEKTAGGKNCYNSINSAFKNGRIFSGSASGSFTIKTSAKGGGFVYMGKNDANAFSLAHECGHYFCGENCLDFLPTDTAETAAMLNESLFLIYLTGESSPLSNSEKEYIKNRKLFELSVVSLAALAIDDFEQSVYSDYYKTDDFKDGIDYADYGLLFKLILSEYGISDYVSSDYWKTAAFGDSFYYFSYAMASLCALGFYYKAQECGFLQAAENYFAFLKGVEITPVTESGVNLCARCFKNYFGVSGYPVGGADSGSVGSADYISFKTALGIAGLKYPFDEEFYAVFG